MLQNVCNTGRSQLFKVALKRALKRVLTLDDIHGWQPLLMARTSPAGDAVI